MGFSMPFFPIYAAEMLADGRFQGWSLEERGAWVTLLAYAWNDGSIPAAHTQLARLLRVESGEMARIWSAIGDRFAAHPTEQGRLISPRLEDERDKAVQIGRKRAAAGREGAKARWGEKNRRRGKRMRLPSETHSGADGSATAVAVAKNSTPPSPPPPPPQEAAAAVAPARVAAGAPDDDLPPRSLGVVDEGGGAPPPERWPKARSFREALTASMARTALYPIGGNEPTVLTSLEASLGVIPEADAVAICRQRILDAIAARKPQPGSLAYFAQVLADEAVRRRAVAAAAPPPAPVVELDAGWLAHLGPRRAAAEEAWDELRERVARSAYPDALPRLLGEARAQLMAEFSEAPVGAAGGA
jgi:uncharacterized protein YdaU (DUF1376 family)